MQLIYSAQQNFFKLMTHSDILTGEAIRDFGQLNAKARYNPARTTARAEKFV